MKIPKKGALSNCNNWKGVTLLSVPSNILAKIIIPRASRFSKGKGCIEQIFTLRTIIEQCTEWQRQLNITF